MKIDEKSTRIQSLNAYGQWKDVWRKHAKHHSTMPQKSFDDLVNTGLGKACLLIANGASFEENLETIQKNQKHVDIMVCDKALGHCLDHGIQPTYVMVCDAVIDYDKYMAKYKDMVSDVILFAPVTANIKWTSEPRWKDVYFFVNDDVIESHKEFSELSGCKNFIPAATNVSNQMLVLLNQSNNHGRNNFFGYDKLLLIGYDFCWREHGNYYSFSKDGGGKHEYMRHIYLYDANGDFVYTSTNLYFSCAWLTKYINTFHIPVINCTRKSILFTKHHGKLEKQMLYNFRTEDGEKVRKLLKERSKALAFLRQADTIIKDIGRAHYNSFVASV
jgi:hypothetical protein